MPDYGIAAQIKPPEAPANPLGVASQVVGIQNAMNQNRLFGQQYAGNVAAGQAAAGAVDAGGNFDANKFLGTLAQNPAGAFRVPEAAQEALARQGQELTNQQAALKLKHDQSSAISEGLFPLARAAATGKPITDDDLKSTTLDLLQNPLFQTPDMIKGLTTEYANLVGLSPDKRAQAVVQHYLRFHANTEGISAAIGQPANIDTGAAVQPITQGGITGPAASAQPIVKSLTPGEEAAPRPTFANGQPGTVPTSAVVNPQGFARGAGGDLPTIGGQPSGAPAIGAPGASGAPAGFLPSGPKIGATAAADVSGAASANQGIALQSRADAVPNNKALLGNLESSLQDFTSGPGADWKRVASAFVNANSPFGPMFDPKKIASQEEFTKQATQLAQSQFQALGGTGTDNKLDSAMHTSPNDALSKMGNHGIISLLKGNEDAINAKNQAWQMWLQHGKGPESYGQFSTQFNQLYDPRVFQAQYMTPEERQGMLRGMTKAEQTGFARKLSDAKKLGWVQ